MREGLPRSLSAAIPVALFAALWAFLWPHSAFAQALKLDARTMVFHEPAPGSSMTVVTPSTDLSANPWEFLEVSAGWEADIVSGASERIKAGPILARIPDIVSGASVHDTRHLGRGSVRVKREDVQLSVAGSTSSENDYKSKSLSATAQTDLFQHDTQLSLDYARNWDTVCDIVHAGNTDATLRQPLDTSKGCFDPGSQTRTTRPVRTDAFQVSWSQAWTPVLVTQVVMTGQLQHGFLSDPYRAVVLSPVGQYAQEHHPDNRAREALALRGAYFFRSFKGAVRGEVRAYRDTWDVKSGTVQLELEKYVSPWLRARARGRYYRQGGALFWSDDYTGGEGHGPRGQYWSGDRELSPFSSYLVGLRLLASWNADDKRLLGIFQGFEAAASLDLLLYKYEDFTLAGKDPQDTRAYIGSLGLTALF